MIIYIHSERDLQFGWSGICSSMERYIKYMCTAKTMIRFDGKQGWPLGLAVFPDYSEVATAVIVSVWSW